MGTGMWTALGILAALRERDRTGQGIRISGSLFDTALTWSGYHLLGALSDGTVAPRFGTQLPMIAPYGTFPTSDGEIMVAVGTDALFARLCGALTLGPLHQEPAFAHNPDRVRNREELNLRVSRASRRHTSEELLTLLREAGVPCAPVLDVEEILRDPQFAAAEMLEPAEPLPQATPPGADGNARNVPLPLRWNGDRWPVRGPAGEVGGETREVLEEAGVPEEVIREILGETRD
jgi:crotonobetainyl-CoA:carnitine CoA-transferase CaiB-like acyl-CoA transferase